MLNVQSNLPLRSDFLPFEHLNIYCGPAVSHVGNWKMQGCCSCLSLETLSPSRSGKVKRVRMCWCQLESWGGTGQFRSAWGCCWGWGACSGMLTFDICWDFMLGLWILERGSAGQNFILGKRHLKLPSSHTHTRTQTHKPQTNQTKKKKATSKSF